MTHVKKILPAACALLSAFLLWSTLPPLDHSGNAWFALIPLLLLARFSAPGRAFRFAWLGGFVYWCASLLWLWQLIGNGGPLILVILGQTVFAAYLGLYWGLFAFASASLWRLTAREDARPPRACFAVLLACLGEPLLWAGTECIRAHMFTGFPWNNLGVSVATNLPAIQLAEFGGVYAVSFIVLLANAGLASLATRMYVAVVKRFPIQDTPHPLEKIFSRQPAAMSLSFIPIALVAAALIYGAGAMKRARTATPATHDTWLAGLVQPNTPSIFQITDDIVLRQRAELDTRTRELAFMRPDFILWPESALIADIPYDRHAYALARDVARDSGAYIIAGGIESRPLSDAGKEFETFNALWLFGPDGGVRARYHKQHLVPFGEFIPGRSIIPALDKLTPGGLPCAAGAGPVLFEITKRGSTDGSQKLLAGALICFEDLFPYLSREPVLLGARVLLNATNDAWFEGSLEPEIHLRQSIFRAVENRVPLLRATNTGVTCAITPYGRVTRLADDTGNTVSFSGWTTALLVLPKDFTPTFYTRHGDRFFALPAAGFLLLTLFASFAPFVYKRKNKSQNF